jgi:hypothetical protein
MLKFGVLTQSVLSNNQLKFQLALCHQRISVSTFVIFCLHETCVEIHIVDSSDAGSNPAEVVEFLRTEKFREQVLREVLQAV